MSTTAATTPTASARWKDCDDIYPTPEEIASALQDAGSAVPARERGRDTAAQTKYKKIDKLASAVCTKILNKFQPDTSTQRTA